jgi:hypothetical protein
MIRHLQLSYILLSVLQTGRVRFAGSGRVPGIKKNRSGYEYDCILGPGPATGAEITTFRKF